MIGKTVGHYRILEKLGQGGMGVVYKAVDTRLDRHVAIKFLAPHLSADGNARTRFIHEARAASALDHPNIGTIYEIGEASDGRTFISMAYYEGETLQERLQKESVATEEALDIILQIASGLAEAHGRDIVHRDIKPANVLVTRSGQAKIVDFGLAKLSGHTRVTQTGMTLGTVAYMSPEQTRGEGVDHRADIWALGVVLYETLAGEPPFKGGFSEAVLYSILHEPPAPLAARRSDVPEELERIVMKALTKDPAQRYQTVGELVSDLTVLRDALRTGSRPVLRAPRWRKPGAKTLARGGIAVLVVVAAAFAARFFAVGPGVPAATAVAVLPFENLSDDKENEYFSDGITEDILTQLSKIGALTVISRASVMGYKGSNKKVKEIGKELGVGTILSGSVRRSGDQVRIVGRLIDATTERQLWSDSYDREMSDIFAIQSDVAEQIAAALRARLTPIEKQRIEKPPTRNLTAYDYYLKGRGYYYEYNQQANENAIELFKSAIKLDDGFALAFAGLGNAYAQRSNRFQMGSEWADSANAASERALALDPELAEAHKSLGLAYFVKGHLHKALELTQRSVDINPNFAGAIGNIGGILISMGRCDEALPWMKKAVTLSPTRGFYYSGVGTAYFGLADDARLEEWSRRALAIQPDFTGAEAGIGFMYLSQGRAARAKEVADRILQASPGDFFGLHLAGGAALALGDYGEARRYYEALLQDDDLADTYTSKRPSTSLGYVYWKQGIADSSRAMVARALERDHKDLAAGSEWPDIPYDLAAAHAVLGNTEEALQWLERAIDAGWRYYRLGQSDPLFERLSADERFGALIDRVRRDVELMRGRVADDG
ncbi:MAG: protein kinase [Candidatus Krumholzibacteriia bacterium]